MGDGLAWIMVEDGGGESGDMALMLPELCCQRGFETERQIVKPLGRAVQQRGDARLRTGDGQTREPLARLQKLKAGRAVQAVNQVCDTLRDLVLGLGNQLGGGRGGGSAQVGGKIGNGEICFVTDGGNHGQARSGYGASHALAVECGQVFQRSAAAG